MKTTVSHIVSALKKTLTEATDATRTAQTGIAAMRAGIADLQRQVREAEDLPLPPGEISARIRDCVADAGANFLHQHGPSLIYGELALASPKIARAGQVRLPGYGADLMTWGALCAAFPDRAVDRLEQLVSKVEYQAGAPLAERSAILERLTRELQDMDAAEEQAIDAMAAAGVVIAHRPEVTERRARDARRRELEEQQTADRRARQAAVEATHRHRPRVVQSEYLRQSATDQPNPRWQ